MKRPTQGSAVNTAAQQRGFVFNGPTKVFAEP